MKAQRPTKGDKKEMQQNMHLTRPPRLEGVVKNAKLEPKKKPKRPRPTKEVSRKPQDYSASERKDYHLKSKKH